MNWRIGFLALRAKWYWVLAMGISEWFYVQTILFGGWIVFGVGGTTYIYSLALNPAIMGLVTGILVVTTFSKAKQWAKEADQKAAAKLFGENLDTEA